MGPGLHGTALCPTGRLLGFLPAPLRRLPVRGLTRALRLSLCRTHPPAPGNAAAPERLEALKYQRIKKPKKSSKGSSKSKKRSGKWWEAPRSPLSTSPVMIVGLFPLGPPSLGLSLGLNPSVLSLSVSLELEFATNAPSNCHVRIGKRRLKSPLVLLVLFPPAREPFLSVACVFSKSPSAYTVRNDGILC